MLSGEIGFNMIVVFVFCGIICGVVHNMFCLFKKVTKGNLIVNNFIDIVSCLICGLIFVVFVFKYNFGEFKLFQAVFFVVGIVILQIFIKNSFARLVRLVYNKVNNKRNLIKK